MRFKERFHLAPSTPDDIAIKNSFSKNPLVLKFFFNLLILLYIHYKVFWALPQKSNFLKNGITKCDPVSFVNCYTFKNLGYLKVFYLLWIVWFVLSAL